MEPIDLRVQSEVAPHKEQNNERLSFLGRIFGRPLFLSEKIILGGMIVVFVFAFYIALDANKYRAVVQVVGGEGKVGINPTSEVLDFGDLSRGSTAARHVEIKNNTAIPFLVAVVRIGGISSLMELDKNFFVLSEFATDRVGFSVYMPASAEIGAVLLGRVYVFKIPTFWKVVGG
jgi:hypothetical protein